MATIPLEFSLLVWTFAGPISNRPAVCTMGVGDPPGGWDTTMMAAARDAWADNILPRQGARWKLVKTTAYQGASGGSVAFELTSDLAGSIVQGATAPPNVAALIRKHTAAAGRANRGRMFVPGVTDSQLEDDGKFASGEYTSWLTAATGLFQDLTTASIPPFILHSPASGGGVPAPTAITSLTVDQLCSTQRRRLR